MPKEEGDGVGPKGEGARRAPLGEFAAWMFPAHSQLMRSLSLPLLLSLSHTQTNPHTHTKAEAGQQLQPYD